MARFLALLGLALAASAAAGAPPGPDAETAFELKVRPVLAGTCLRCHGGAKVSGGLRVDSRAALLKGGDSGPAVVPGDPDNSLLLRAVRRTHETLRMPPDKKLSDAEVADLAAWVKGGAPWPAATRPFAADTHWAFRPVRAADPPPDPSGWADGPVDRFIASGLRAHGLKPVAPADKRTLLRRVTFDLTGLPPTPEEVDDFLADTSAGALARVIERLLASPAYGERWGRHWLDVARYADTAGDNADYPVPEARLYRDYVIDSFNADKPYDRFVRDQLAGDILAKEGPPEKYAEQVAATGFLALSRRYATAPYELWHLTLEDTIDVTGQAFLGLTLRCARCHDHKFDPVTQKDYYGLYAVFAATTFPYGGSEELASKGFPRQNMAPLVPPAEAAPRLEAHRRKLEQLQKQIDEGAKNKLPQDKLKALREELKALRRPGLPADLPAAYAVSDGKPVPQAVHLRGEPATPGPAVERGVPRFLAGDRVIRWPADGSGRRELADWVADAKNPLAARVMVNRIWQHHFGRGLVGTPSNFGVRGEVPTHPELLDWLADRFVRDGWSIKALHRHIVLSKTYQLSSAADSADAARDPDNRYRWRFDRRRLDAEALRDALLMVGGRLDRTRPGPHPFPSAAGWGWTQHNPFKAVYLSHHRSVYLMTQRIQRHPYLALFDGPDANHSTGKRTSATVPLQALYLMNNPFVREQAEGLARRLLAASPDPAGRVGHALALAWGRPAAPEEVAQGVAYVRRYAEELARAGTPEAGRELEAWTSYARVVLTANEFLYVD
jgi:cytochrome c553